MGKLVAVILGIIAFVVAIFALIMGKSNKNDIPIRKVDKLDADTVIKIVKDKSNKKK